RGVRIGRAQGRGFGGGATGDAAIDFIGGNLYELLHPKLPGRFQQCESAEHVGLDEVVGPEDRAVDMCFGSEVDDNVEAVTPKFAHQLTVGDVTADEFMALRIGKIFQILEVAGVAEFVEVNDVPVGVAGQGEADEM